MLELWDKEPDAEQWIGASQLSVLEQAARVARTAGENERGAKYASAALKEIDPAAEPVRAALLLETRALLRKHSDTDDVVADLRAALDLVPPGVADAARAQVLVALAKHGWQLRGPEASAAVDEALELARRAGDAATQATALDELAVIRFDSGDDTYALELLGLARAVAERAEARYRRQAVHLGQDRERPRVEHPGQDGRRQPRRGGRRGAPAAPVRRR